ncbi:uncharacterized LOC8262908 [Olea europaea subsp. europaea]|uniref:Uncharacterized LOC8262908 n=1 Tax=Olea europaea subsp. europaea TaxID=158383 RepID=A0A8S0TJC4_OLEEU|nr:uncharacterized LOC8262908 [Olea europaea subsp. europaea]
MDFKCNKSFCSDYMLLKPEEAGLIDVFRILFSDDIGKRKFIDCPEGKRPEPFKRRLLIFVSILVQKLLLAVEKPMAWFGSLVEQWLNLLSSNGSLSSLILNFVRGKVIYPKKTATSFKSIIGNVDNRRELDDKIKRGDKRYDAALSMMAAKVSYENKGLHLIYGHGILEDYCTSNSFLSFFSIQMDFLGSYYFWNDYQEKATTQAFMFNDQNDKIAVAFRGTEPFDANAWLTDFDISWYCLTKSSKKVLTVNKGTTMMVWFDHGMGFQALERRAADKKQEVPYYAIRKILKQILQKNEKAKFIITGHSLGGALAILFPAILAFHQETWLLER